MDKIDYRDLILRIFKDNGFDEYNCSYFKKGDIADIADEIIEKLPIYSSSLQLKEKYTPTFSEWREAKGIGRDGNEFIWNENWYKEGELEFYYHKEIKDNL